MLESVHAPESGLFKRIFVAFLILLDSRKEIESDEMLQRSLAGVSS